MRAKGEGQTPPTMKRLQTPSSSNAHTGKREPKYSLNTTDALTIYPAYDGFGKILAARTQCSVPAVASTASRSIRPVLYIKHARYVLLLYLDVRIYLPS